MTDATYKTGQALRFRQFTKEDYYGFGGAESEPGMPPMIADNLDENMAIVTYTTCEIHNADGKIYSKTIGRGLNTRYGFYINFLSNFTDDMITTKWLESNGFNHIGDAF